MTFGVNKLGHTQEGKLCRGFVLNGLYQWVNDLSCLSTGLKWFLGLGGAVLDHGSLSHDMYGAGVLGQIGVEYHFNSPWELSLDYRPGFYWLPGAGNIYRISPSISVHYCFSVDVKNAGPCKNLAFIFPINISVWRKWLCENE